MAVPTPLSATWDLTYACQLRCGYCYSESGRRAAAKLPHADLLRIADTLVAMGLRAVQISGGEPLLVEGLPEIVRRLRAGRVKVALFTNGLLVNDDNALDLGRLFRRIHVSLDGATAEVHDRVRGREGAFDGALAALAALDRASVARRALDGKPISFGTDTMLVRDNFHEAEAICRDVAPRFPRMSFACFGAAAPAGPANSERFADEHLLSVAELGILRDASFKERLRALLPPSVKELRVVDNFNLTADPERTARGESCEEFLHIEADGGVRSMNMYEGIVGNLLYDPPDLLWQRALERRRHPFALRVLSSINTLQDWAAAARRVDWEFASDEVRDRISRRAGPPQKR